MNKRRLLKLADLLEADAKNKKGVKFDMGGWAFISDQAKPMSCGTEACAMGLAAISGAFKRAGLGHRVTVYGGIEFQWRGKGTDGFEAAEELFEIGINEAMGLFVGSGTGARAEIAKAKQIRKFVATGKL